MKKRFRQSFVRKIVPRIFAATILLCWLGNAAPLLAMAFVSDNDCQMDCCQGMARHAANSCAGGECHLTRKKSVQSEIICGADALVPKTIVARQHKISLISSNKFGVPIFDASDDTDSHERGSKLPFPQIKITEQNCETVCSLGAAHSSQQQPRPDERSTLVSFAALPRPPTSSILEFDADLVHTAVQNLRRQTPARAPPIFFS